MPYVNRCAFASPSRHRTLAAAAALLALSGLLPAQAASDASPAACPALIQQTFPRLQDEKPQNLCQYSGKVLVVVNTASYCGFTSQYKGLEELYAKYKDRGLVVLGFPSNDFGGQEPGDNKKIAEFCENTFGVKFPMLAKSSVRGNSINPLYQQLAAKTGKLPQWNFHKYVIARDGSTVSSFSSGTDPQASSFVAEIEKRLADK